MRKTLFFSALLILAVLMPRLAQTAETDSSPEKRDPVLIYREAGADTEQEAKIRQFAQEYDKAARVRVDRLRNLSKQMKELTYDPEADEKRVLALQDEINQLQNSLNNDRVKMFFQIRAALTGDQRVKLVELLRERESEKLTSKAKVEPNKTTASAKE